MKVLCCVVMLAAFSPGFVEAAFADCTPLTIATSVDMERTADELSDYVPVTINGVDEYMLLDTGGAVTEITPEAADALKLERKKGNIQQFNVSGLPSDDAVTATLSVGTIVAQRGDFILAPGSNPFGPDAPIAGILSPDLLSQYDLNIDFGAHKLTLLLPDHCEGKVIYWPASVVAVVPIRVLTSGHIIVPVQIDGKTVNALIDTGAATTTLTTVSAISDFGLKLGSKDTPKTGHLLDRPDATTYQHAFKTLGFEGITVSNPRVMIFPDMTRGQLVNRPALGTLLADAKKAEDKIDMLLGMDVLRHLHIFIAYKEEKLYITPAEPAAPITATTQSAH